MDSAAEKLKADNAVLSEQIKHLLKSKHDLYVIQNKVESQLGLYRDLYETGGRINAAAVPEEIFAALLDFVIYKLNLERCAVFLRRDDGGALAVVAVEGYYDDNPKAAVAAATLDAAFAERLGTAKYFLSGEADVDLDLGERLHMDRWTAFPFLDDAKTVVGLLVAGNTRENAEYYSAIDRNGEAFVGLANVAALANTALNNVRSYQALREERELLETRVAERTHDLRREIEDRTRVENQLQHILDTSPVGISIVARGSLQRLYSNPTFRGMVGYGPDDDITADHPVNTFANSEDLTRLQMIYDATGEVSGEIVERKRVDGGSWWALTDWRPIVYDGRDAFIVWHYDISARRQAEEALRQANEEQQTLIENALIGIMISADGRVIQCNRQFIDILGYGDAGDLHGKPTSIFFVSPDDFGRFAKTVGPVLGSGGTVDIEWQLARADGAPCWMHISAKPVQARGNQYRTVWLMADITERRRAEEALVKAKQEAEAATVAKSDFLARMSHEIRTPMNAVIGLTHLALRTELSPKQRDYLRKIRGSSQALLGIINDILDFSKIEAGRLALEHIVFDLQDVIDNLANVVTVKAEEKGLEILLAVDPAVPHRLKGDPLRLGQVLVNLASNAVKFTDKGEVVISVRLAAKETDRVRLRFAVRDSGIGMTEAQKAGLFESFYQADGSITRRYGGTGLGLAISKQLVEMMDGVLTVDSEFGKGSTFAFDVAFGAVEAAGRQTFLVPGDLAGKPVLVVDDNATSRAILREMLEGFSFAVETADSGERAIAMLDERARGGGESFGMVLMDWKMPGLDGIETARRIKSDERLPHVPAILMVTAYGRDEVMQAAEDAGLDGFLSKPVGQSLLFNTIMETMGHADEVQQGGDNRGATPSDRLRGIRGARVLLVEDNPINQQVASEFLEQAGLVVELAVNGREGLEKAATGGYELILMDVQMPEMDGLEATRHIRARGQAEVPIVAMTAHAMAGDREHSLAAGMNDHLTKPIDPKELEDMLVRWIPAASRQAPAGAPARAGTEPADAVALPALPDLDAALGVRRVGGSPRLFLKLLREFAATDADAAERIAAERAAGRRYDAERSAHSVKGAAASLGAVALAEIAQTLETALRADDAAAADAAAAAFAPALASLCAGVREFFAATNADAPPPQAAGTASPAEVRGLLLRLAEALVQGSSKAEHVAAELRAALAGRGFDAALDELEENIDDVEFEAALDVARRLTDAVGGEE